MDDDTRCRTCDHDIADHDWETFGGHPYLVCQLKECDYCCGFESVAAAAERQWEHNQRAMANG